MSPCTIMERLHGIVCYQVQARGLAGSTLQVDQHLRQGEAITVQPLDHRIFLVGLYADAPARQKWALMLAVAAYLGCGFCLFQGTRIGSNMTFMGYVDQTPQDIVFQGTPMQANDERLELSHE